MAPQKRRKAGRKKSDPFPGWLHMVAGLAIGLAVAYGIYVSDRRQLSIPAQPVPEPAVATAPQEVIEVMPVEAGITFDFYDMLPNLDVDLYDNAAAPQPLAQSVAQPQTQAEATMATAGLSEAPPSPAPTAPVEPAAPVAQKPGIYILQAGSFSVLEVAQRRKAEMTELGVPSEIKRGNVNGKTVYRVYTAPMDKPEDVNRVRTLLIGVGIDILQKRVSD